MNETVLIVGSGFGLSASLARLFTKKGMKVVLVARNIEKLKNFAKNINAETIKCDASNITEVKKLFQSTDKLIGVPNLVIYNPSYRIKGSITELDPVEIQKAINITCFGAFLVAREAVKRMLTREIKKARILALLPFVVDPRQN